MVSDISLIAVVISDWGKTVDVFSELQRTDKIVLRTLTSVPMVKYEMLGLAAKYGLSDVRERLSVIRDSVWSCSVQKVQL